MRTRPKQPPPLPQPWQQMVSDPLSAGSQLLSSAAQVSNTLVNEALLVCVLALTAYAVLTVDAEAWRGCKPPLSIIR